jgi:hypothetical protein
MDDPPSDPLYDPKGSNAQHVYRHLGGPITCGCSFSSKAISVLNVRRVPSRMTFGVSLFPIAGSILDCLHCLKMLYFLKI